MITISCSVCQQKHDLDLDTNNLTEKQKGGLEPISINFICPNLATMYKVKNFVVETCSNSINDFIKQDLSRHYGIENFNEKLKRFVNLNLYFIGIPEEYYDLLKHIVDAYCCGYFYPSIAGAGALGERILNRLIIKTKKYYTSSPHYKKIHNKKSFENWDMMVSILLDWNIINEEVAELFRELKRHRNDVIHYNEGYNFEENSLIAIKLLVEIINKQFSYIERKDLCWVFDVPGEILVKSKVINDPFVIEFLLPHCIKITPYSNKVHEIKQNKIILGNISDEKFIELRNAKEFPL